MSPQPKPIKAVWWQPAVELFVRIAGWIVFPIILALYVGRWLDVKFNKEPLFYFICIGVAFVATISGLIIETMKAVRKIEKAATEGNKNKQLK